jgi:hypothetical protein
MIASGWLVTMIGHTLTIINRSVTMIGPPCVLSGSSSLANHGG